MMLEILDGTFLLDFFCSGLLEKKSAMIIQQQTIALPVDEI